MTTSLFFTAIAAMLVGCAVADRSLLAAPSTPDIYSTGLQPSGACDLAKARWWGCKKQADRLYPGSNGYVIRFANISGCLDTLFDDFCGPDTDISNVRAVMVLKAEDITLTGASFTGCCRNKPGACPAGANKFGVTNVNFNGEDITAVASQVFGTDSEGNVMVYSAFSPYFLFETECSYNKAGKGKPKCYGRYNKYFGVGVPQEAQLRLCITDDMASSQYCGADGADALTNAFGISVSDLTKIAEAKYPDTCKPGGLYLGYVPGTTNVGEMTLSGMPTAVKFQCVKDGVADGEPRSFSDVLAAFADMSGVTIDDQNCPDPSTYP